ncbi:MAG: cytochrome c maturation protein CcmE [bacterium]|nr:cytochrome c maturation protein CcmE [bacterium]
MTETPADPAPQPAGAGEGDAVGAGGAAADGEGAAGAAESDAGAAGLDLTPRRREDRRGRRPPTARRVISLLVVAAAVGGITFALVRLVTDASLFFLNTDEAVERRDELSGQRFRMQGTPVAHSVTETRVDFEQAVAFSVSFEGVSADVVHVGSPPDLFTPGVPVVLEGRWIEGVPPDLDTFACGVNDGYYFASDHMLVKHDNEYRDTYPDRLDAAGAGGAAEGC